jgi:hypothetical protein
MGKRGMHIEFWWESRKERDHYEDIDVGGMVWIDLAHDKDQWRALVNTVINLRVP